MFGRCKVEEVIGSRRSARGTAESSQVWIPRQREERLEMNVRKDSALGRQNDAVVFGVGISSCLGRFWRPLRGADLGELRFRWLRAASPPATFCRPAGTGLMVGLALVLALLCPPAVAEKVSASTSQMVQPLLIRNEHNALLHLRIDCEEAHVHLKSLTLSLQGAEAFASLQCYAIGNATSRSSEKTFGDRRPAANEVVLTGHARMKKGENHFWISCRMKPNADLTKRVDATVTSIDTSAGKMTPRDATPKVSKRVGIALRKHWDDGVHTYRIPALCTTTKGSLLCVYDMRRNRGKDLQEDIDIGLMRSTDGGRTWESQKIIMDMGSFGGLGQEINGCSDPGIIVDPITGEIFCFGVWMHKKAGKHQWNGDGSERGLEIGKSAQFMMIRSHDDGVTWTKPKNMTKTWKNPKWILYAPSPQSGIALRDGTLVMPAEGRDENDRRFSNLLVSRDRGKNWTVSNIAARESTECQVVELSDGLLMLNSRSDHPTKFRTVVTTKDLGETWEAHPTNRNTLIEPNCNGSLIRFDYRDDAGNPESVLFFCNPHSQKGRSHQSIQVSFDEGKTWPKKYRILLDEGRGKGYPSLTRIDDQHLGVIYEGSAAHLVFEKLSLKELLKR